VTPRADAPADRQARGRGLKAARAEISRVLDAGYVRGADCWHLAAALYLAEDPAHLSFPALNERQGAVAAALGFRT
jgi:hypothetical protein